MRAALDTVPSRSINRGRCDRQHGRSHATLEGKSIRAIGQFFHLTMRPAAGLRIAWPRACRVTHRLAMRTVNHGRQGEVSGKIKLKRWRQKRRWNNSRTLYPPTSTVRRRLTASARLAGRRRRLTHRKTAEDVPTARFLSGATDLIALGRRLGICHKGRASIPRPQATATAMPPMPHQLRRMPIATIWRRR